MRTAAASLVGLDAVNQGDSWMSFNRISWTVLTIAAGLSGALACGPDFPWQLLDSRAHAVAEPIGLSFTAEALRLVAPPRDGLKVVEQADPPWADRDKAEPEAVFAERQEVGSEELLAKLKAAREAADGKAALEAGAGLPVAMLEYIAGAVEFRADRFDTAKEHFEAIDRLPPEQQAIRAVAASYMQGRVHQRTGDMMAARAAFQAARERARGGAPDPLGLAVASLGEEARIDLVEARLVEPPLAWSVPASKDDDAKAASLVANAVRLYAEQAARGSKMGLLSLRQVAELLVADTLLDRAIADPLVRRLVVAYVVARDGESPWDSNGSQSPAAEQVIDAVLARSAVSAGDDLDRLAAVAYQGARYEVAEKLTAATDRPLGLWVRAKLALRRGDRAAAARDWTAALGGTGSAGTQLDEAAKTRLRGELAVVRLSQGEYRDSLQLLFPVAGTYWGDVAYIAERVLTVDELKSFVDGLPAAGPAKTATEDEERSFRMVANPLESLRALLARRLTREGRAGEALAYFPASSRRPASDQAEQDRPVAEDAREYLAATEAARPAAWPWQNVSRAEALFKVAMLARKRGMELMGTEGPPDEAALDGMFQYGIGQSDPLGTPLSEYADDADRAKFKANAERNRALLGPDEAARFAASAPKPDVRFHYRVVATDQALAAADLLPQRSQAYAATLCWATRFAFDSRDDARAAQIYRRYVATGAYQAWAAKRFGRVCPQPDFAGARHFWPKRIVSWPGEAASAAWRRISGLWRAKPA